MPPFPSIRRARHDACLNGGLWATGNGLASSSLVIYLAFELGAPRVGLGIALLRAAPHLTGLLRLGAPALIGRWVDRKRFCIGAYLASALVLTTLPWLSRPGLLSTPSQSLTALVLLWCTYHVLQYLADVALWSWLADLAPQRVRGRFLGRRERWLSGGSMAGMLGGGLISQAWKHLHPNQPELVWLGYAIAATLGAGLMLAALGPLVRMPSLTAHKTPPTQRGQVRVFGQGSDRKTTLGGRKTDQTPNFAGLATAFRDGAFWRLLLFGCWFSTFNGLFQAPQDFYPARVLGVSLLVTHCLLVVLRGGQIAISPWVGRQIDRFGNRPVMMVALALVAAGPLCYCASSPERPWWFAGAALLWIAYVGINIGLPNLLLGLAPRAENASYIAAYHAVTGLCVAVSMTVGGLLFDHFRARLFSVPGLALTLDYCQLAFLLAWLLRSLGIGVLWAVVREPRAAIEDERR